MTRFSLHFLSNDRVQRGRPYWEINSPHCFDPLVLLFPFRIGILYSTRPPPLSSPANLTSRFTHAYSIISPRPRSTEIRKRLYRARGYHNWERFVCTSFILRFLPSDSKEGAERWNLCWITCYRPAISNENSFHILGNYSTLFSFVTLFTEF